MLRAEGDYCFLTIFVTLFHIKRCFYGYPVEFVLVIRRNSRYIHPKKLLYFIFIQEGIGINTADTLYLISGCDSYS